MTRRRWIADECSGNRAALTGAHAEHLSRVLRARVGQEFDIAAGPDLRRGRIALITESRVEFELGEAVPVSPAPDITVALSIFKFDRMDWAIEKCTELGASRILPVIASRTDTHLASAARKRGPRWQKLAHQAAEQSRRLAPPEIGEPIGWREAATLAGGLRIVFSELEREVMLKDVLEPGVPGGPLVLNFGPEGGWTPGELEFFRQNGWVFASLGDRILRAETAVTAALAVVISSLSA